MGRMQIRQLCRRGRCATPEHQVILFSGLQGPGVGASGTGASRASAPHPQRPAPAASRSPPPWRRRSAQSGGWAAGCPRAGGARSRAGAVWFRGALPASLSSGRPPIAACSPGPAMGNMPSAVKHCLSYQQLLREHLGIADSVAGALDPAQVPPRGPGCPRPMYTAGRPFPVMSPLHPRALPAAVCLVRPRFRHLLCCKHVDPPSEQTQQNLYLRPFAGPLRKLFLLRFPSEGMHRIIPFVAVGTAPRMVL